MANENETHKMTDLEAIFAFFFGGLAIFTILNTKSMNRFTYKVTSKEGNDGSTIYFVSVLTGSNNETDYTFLGTIFDNGVYYHGRKSRIGKDAMSVKAFAWFYNKLNRHFSADGEDFNLGTVEFYHEGCCARCGRKLTIPESVEIGFGLTCN